MRRLTCLAILLGVVPALVSAQDTSEPSAPPQPPQDYPTQAPPPPPSEIPPPDQVSEEPSPAPPPIAAPAGQWVYTSQYGMVWSPYDPEYVYVPADPQVFPEQYVYYPVYGWRWVVAPWVYGYGPQPRWGAGGATRFAWYAHPWFRVGGYWGWGGYRGWGQYRGWMGPRAWSARGWTGAPPHDRTGVGARHAPLHPSRGEHERTRGEHTGRER